MNTIHPWELDDFYRKVRAVVLELEQAFLDGTLARRLEHADVRELGGNYLFKTYQRLIIDDPRCHRDLRLDAVRTLLEQVRLELFDVRNKGSAKLVLADAVGSDGMPDSCPFVCATLQGRTANLRLDQFLALRSWGVGFDFDLPEADDAFSFLIAANTVQRLSRDLRCLHTLLARFKPRRPAVSLQVVLRPKQRAFERLMLDILNEQQHVSRFASLDEDFLGKVDLHIRLREMDGGRDVPIQVTQITDPARYEDKLSKIWHKEQMVILSPRSLAAFFIQQMTPDEAVPCLSPVDVSAVWACIVELPSTQDELAVSLKRILIRGLRQSNDDPRGPMAHVPQAVRALVRAFVQEDATRALRAARQLAPDDAVETVRRTPTLGTDIPKPLKRAMRETARRSGISRYVIRANVHRRGLERCGLRPIHRHRRSVRAPARRQIAAQGRAVEVAFFERGEDHGHD